MNGRMRGDEEGKYTHIGKNGASVEEWSSN